MVFFRLLERYQGARKKNLALPETNASFVQDFLAFGKEEKYSESTLYRTINFVRTALNLLEKRGIRTFVYELELPKAQRQHSVVTLSEDDLVKIKRMPVPPHLGAARDWLVISCYTGQRLSDFMNFDTGMLQTIQGRNCLAFSQQKTKKNILLPLHPAVSTIMAQNGQGFPARVQPQKYNEQIKTISKMAGICNPVKVRKRTGFRRQISTVPKWEAISSHIGRRSFASNFYGKIPTPLLMEATGHSSEQMFHRYINHVDIERAKSLGMYFDQAYKMKFVGT